MSRVLGIWLSVVVLLVAPWSLRAAERINDYEVDIELAENGVLQITERILVTARADEIVHGIKREIPLAFIAADGHRARSFLTVLDIKRDGSAEPYEITENNRGAVIRIGSSNVELAPDTYLYELHYQVNRVINFLEDHDQLVWNVNGNEGRFPIDALTGRIELPDGAEPISANMYTGRFGDTGGDAVLKTFGNVVTFSATRAYSAGENMTIELLLPKGVIQPPDEETLYEWERHDHESSRSAALTFAWSASLAFFLWLLFGRDPRRGVIVPRWDPPGGISPGRIGYCVSRNFATGFWTAFSASIIELAVKGKLVLEDLSDGITVRKVSDEQDALLPAEQAAIMQMLPPAGARFRFDSANAIQASELGEAFCSAIHKDIGDQFYKPRRWISVSFTLLMILALAIHEISFTVGVEYLDGWLPSHWVWALVAWFFAMNAVRKLRQWAFPGQSGTKGRLSILMNLFIAAALVWVFTQFIYANEPVPRDGFMLAFSLALTATLLWAVIGRLSRQGREVMDGIEGLRLYLELAEKDRMALVDAPALSPAHFETLLPYAVALGVEKAWSRHFETALAHAKEAGSPEAYHPAWYTDYDASAPGGVGGVSDFCSGIASRIEHSVPVESDASGSEPAVSSGSGRGGGGVSGW